MTERELTAGVLELLGLMGWRAIHQRPAQQRSGRWSTAIQGPGSKGWPDVFAVRRGECFAAELKVGSNRPTADQREWLALLEQAGVTAFVWTDKDWNDGTIERVVVHGVSASARARAA